jgi:hypothetical protein
MNIMSRKPPEGENCGLAGLNKLGYMHEVRNKRFIVMLKAVFA